LDQCHRRIVADAEAELEDAQVPAVAALVARPQLGEELHHDLAIAQAVEREALVGERRRLAEGNDRLGDAAQLLRLRQRRADLLLLEERYGPVGESRGARASGVGC